MSRRKRQNGATDAYTQFGVNPNRNRLAVEEQVYMRVLTELSINRFRWVGLPDEIDERFVELLLHNRAMGVFFWDDHYDRYFFSRAAAGGRINHYDNPTEYTAIRNATDRPSLRLTAAECVPVWGNALRRPDTDIVTLFATRLAQIERTIEINVNQMRETVMIAVEESERLSWLNVIRQHDEGQPYLFGTRSLDLAKIQAWPISVEKDQVKNLQLVKSQVWNEAMTMLGINNANQDKRERLVASEVSANDDQIIATRGTALNARRRAAAQINRMFKKLDVRVEWNNEVEDMAREAGVSIPNGGIE